MRRRLRMESRALEQGELTNLRTIDDEGRGRKNHRMDPSAVPEASDGILTSAGICEGFAGAGAGTKVLIFAGFAGLVAGSLAAGAVEYSKPGAERDQQVAEPPIAGPHLSAESQALWLRGVATARWPRGLWPARARRRPGRPR